MLEWKITPSEAGTRLLPFLKKRIPSSLRSLRWAIEHNRCIVNGKVERFCTIILKEKDQVIFIDKEEKKSGEVIFEDEHILLYSKRSEIATENLHRFLENEFAFPLYLAHRLDKDTSGIILFAKTREAQEKCEALFRAKQVKKSYLAIVHGEIENEKGTLKNTMGEIDRKEGEVTFGVVEEKKTKIALTHWTKLRSNKKYTYLRLRPITGITHQIRVQLMALGYPIVGDRRYGSRSVEDSFGCFRTLLHAETLSFPHPVTSEPITAFAPLTSDFAKALITFRLGKKA